MRGVEFLEMFETYSIYDQGNAAEVDGFPKSVEPLWILGKKYSTLYDMDEIKENIKSKLWLTYRKNFAPIGGTGPTSDAGWGCMLRCGQMILAQALLTRHLGQDWRWINDSSNPTYKKILKLFYDKKDSLYSIHQIAQMGAMEGKEVGQWFGPNTIAQVLKKLSIYDKWSSMVIHVALDNAVVTDDIGIK
ncbi:Cysteine protease ATG4B [Nymphon striatum]|nr:Cysteine protease ATG4B [Nymphon striatum]